MAENTEISQFGKGIALNCGFDLGAQTLLDARQLVKDMAELEAMPQIRRANGLAVWVQDERRLMVWDAPNDQWVDVTASVDTSEIEKSVADLSEQVTNNATSITEIRESLSELNPECRFDDTADHKTTAAHGGLPAGTNIRGWKLADILDWVLIPAVAPTVRLTLTDLDGEATKERIFKLGDNRFRQEQDHYEGYKFETMLDFTAQLYPNDLPSDCKHITGQADWVVTPFQNGVGKDGDPLMASYEGTKTLYISWIDDHTEEYISLSSCLLLDYAKSVTVKTTHRFDDAQEYTEKQKQLGLEYNASITLTFAKPIYVGVLGQNKTLSTDSDAAQYYNGTIEGLDSGRAELIIADSVKTQKVNIPAFDNRQMCIVSPRKVTKILNPSSFDITQSFTLTTKNTGALADADTEAGIPAGYADTDLYVYTSDFSSQAAAYPLTITFE